MINFDKHLKELLFEEDFLIIPGLGAFIAKFSQAKLSESGEVIGPVKSFDFNSLLDTDDKNKFINYIVSKENLPKSDIEFQLKNYLFDLKSKLSTNTKVVLSDLCSLEKSKEGSLIGQFISELNFYNKPDFQEDLAKNPKVIFRTPQTISDGVEEQIFNETYTEDFEEEEVRTNWLKYLMYILPLLLVFGALYYVVLYKPFEKKEIVQLENIVPIEKVISDSTIISDNEIITDNIENPKVVQSGLKNVKAQQRFEVSAGVFKKKENAENLVQRMKKAGFIAEIKLVSGMRRVFVGVNGVDEAEAMSKKIEQFTGDKSVYFDDNGISNR
jgi:hypothetical protein